MIISSRILDRFLSIGVYVLIAIGTIWFGSRMINHSLDLKFYNDYLSAWETALANFHSRSGVHPVFSGGNHDAYMRALVDEMLAKLAPPPASNTELPFLYEIDKAGQHPRKLFLLALSDRIVIYNLPSGTIETLDKLIDGEADLKQGFLTGQKSRDNETYIGILKL